MDKTEPMLKSHLQLSDSDREHLQALVRKDTISRKLFQRAGALLDLDAGHTLQHAAARAGVNYNRVAAWRDNYKAVGLEALHDKPRAGRPIHIDGKQRAQVTALACSAAPQGHARWSLRLLANKIVELGYVEAISHNHVKTILKKTNCNRTSKRPGA